MASAEELAALRQCEGCEHRIPNGVTELRNILLAMSDHLVAEHPSSGGSEGGGAKSNDAISQLEEGIYEIQWSAWQARFDRFTLACKLSDKAIENCV